ncbi:MAG TPA: sulfatase-like hydrolase/transferase [Kofleriaceae bacterium]|nr:sulfatase-like hydrolase/transferase [Kofleriaceae bacterium]
MTRGLLVWLERALLHAAAAGAALGAIEALWLSVTAGGSAMLFLCAVGLCALGGALVGGALLAVAGLAARPRWMRGYLADLAAAGPRRVAALARGLVALVALALLALTAYRLAVFTHGRFNAPGAVGLLHAAVVALAAIVILFAALVGAPPLERLLARRVVLHRASRGAAGLVTLAILLAAVAAGTALFLDRAAPDADFRPAAFAAGFLALLVAAARADLAGRLGRRARTSALAALAACAVAALATVGSADAARQRIAANGIATGSVLRALWWASDRDGDGFPSRFGGADCDDGDPRVHPGAAEVPENGTDDNCAGGDLTADMLAFRTRPVPSARPPNRQNVLLVTIDAVRADHTSAYGYRRKTTPSLERLAARGTRFEWAITPSPTTRRAIPALLTGRYASTLAFEESKEVWPPRLVRRRHELLGQSFARAGYHTAAILCCTTMFDRTAGVVEGIAEVDASAARIKQHSAEHMTTRAEAFLAAQTGERPFFLWMHYIDPHNPYDQPAGGADFGDRPIDRYDAEIRLVDDRLGRLLDALDRTGLAARTVVAVASDHGDEFFEHGNEFHGRSLYAELARVPLVIAVPGGAARTAAQPVSLVDLGPTLLDLVGIARPAGQNGRSLAAAVDSDAPPPDRVVLAELIADRNITRNLVAGFHGGWQIIWDQDANTYELYDLARDPATMREVSGDHGDRLAAMRRALAAQIDLDLTPLPSEKPARRPPSGRRARPSR